MSVKASPETFRSGAERIKALGYRVFVEEGRLWGYYSDGVRVAHFFACEWDDGIQTAIVNRTAGGGWQHLVTLPDGQCVPLSGITKPFLEQGFQAYPDYFDEEDKTLMPSRKFESLDEFFRSQSGKLSEF